MSINTQEQYLVANEMLGGLVDVPTAARVAGVSRQRIDRFIEQGWLAVHHCWGRRCLGVDEFVRFCQKTRGSGRPKMVA
jgi:hypothetical protein